MYEYDAKPNTLLGRSYRICSMHKYYSITAHIPRIDQTCSRLLPANM